MVKATVYGLALGLGVFGMVGSVEAQSRTLKGSVAYRARIALPADAVVHVSIEDVSRADAPSRVIAKTSFRSEGRQVPLPFEVTYDAGDLRPQDRYSVRATIESGGRLAWSTDTVYPVKLDGTDPEVNLVLVQVQPSRPDVSKESTQLSGYKWVLYELEGREVEQATWTPHVTFDLEKMQVGGRGGVNMIGGSYRRSGYSLTFGPIRSTMMAGPENQMRIEQRFVSLFPRVTSAKIFGDKLVWYANNVPVAKFAAHPAE